MKDTIWLVMDKRRVVDMRKSKPDLDGGQVAVRLDIEVPPGYFDRMIPQVKLRMPDMEELTADQVEVTFSGVSLEVDHAESEGVAAN